MSSRLAERVKGAVDRLPRRVVDQIVGTRADPLLSTIERLDDAVILRADRWLSWVVTLLIGAFAFAIRMVNLGRPANLVFDETYYAKDAWAMLHFGYEMNWPKDANDLIVAGDTNVWETGAAYVVHPPLGKWLIAFGEHLFGMNSFGWRFGAVIFGTLMIMATIRMARRLSRSTLVGAMAGLFLTVDGLTFVMSRIALLDIYQASFTVMAVACMVADRDWFRIGSQCICANAGSPIWAAPMARCCCGGRGAGRRAWPSGWRSPASGTRCMLAAMGVMAVIYDVTSRRTAGARDAAFRSVLIEAPLAFISMVVTAVVVYFSTWWGWLTTDGGWGRDYGSQHPEDFWVRTLGDPLGSLMRTTRRSSTSIPAGGSPSRRQP